MESEPTPTPGKPAGTPKPNATASDASADVLKLLSRRSPEEWAEADKRLERERVEEEERARAHRRRSSDRLLREAGVMPEFFRARYNDFPSEVVDAVRAAVGDHLKRSGLLVKGPWGTGKTRLAAAIVHDVVVEQGRGAELMLTRQLLRRINQTYRDQARETEDQVLRHLASVPVLVIDDLANERGDSATDATRGALHELLTRRNGHLRFTVVTTNLTNEEIANQYGGSIASRLGGWESVTLLGPDRRSR